MGTDLPTVLPAGSDCLWGPFRVFLPFRLPLLLLMLNYPPDDPTRPARVFLSPLLFPNEFKDNEPLPGRLRLASYYPPLRSHHSQIAKILPFAEPHVDLKRQEALTRHKVFQ